MTKPIMQAISVLQASTSELSKIYETDATGITMSQAYFIVKDTQIIISRMNGLIDKLSPVVNAVR